MIFSKPNFKILFFLFCYLNIVFCYNYKNDIDQNQNTNDEIGNSQPRETYQKKNDFRSQENLDGSYNRPPQFIIENSNSNYRPPLTQRNPNFRSESPLLLRPSVLPMANDVAGDVPVRGETNKRRLLLPDSSKPIRSEDIPLSKNEKLPSKPIPTTFILPLRRIRQPPSNSLSTKQPSESLEQLLNRKPAEKFLGPNFIQQSLANQNGENKFLTVYGKEEREINGTIELKKNGFLNAHLEESKDGSFQVMDRNHNKVGEVNLHRDVDKHIKLSQNNGITNVELEKNTNADLNIEREINLGPKGRFYDSSNKHHLRVHVEQNQNSKAQVELSKIEENKPKYEQENYRYRRDTQEQDHLNSFDPKQNLTFLQKIGNSFNTLSEKAKNAFGETKYQLCQMLINSQTKVDQNMLNSSNLSNEFINENNENKSKFKAVFDKLKKSTFKFVNGLTDKMILKLNNCTQVLSDLKNKPEINQNSFDLNIKNHPSINQIMVNRLDELKINNESALNKTTMIETTTIAMKETVKIEIATVETATIQTTLNKTNLN